MAFSGSCSKRPHWHAGDEEGVNHLKSQEEYALEGQIIVWRTESGQLCVEFDDRDIRAVDDKR